MKVYHVHMEMRDIELADTKPPGYIGYATATQEAENEANAIAQVVAKYTAQGYEIKVLDVKEKPPEYELTFYFKDGKETLIEVQSESFVSSLDILKTLVDIKEEDIKKIVIEPI